MVGEVERLERGAARRDGIAGNLRDIFLNMTPADDLEFRRGTDSPTVRIEGLTMAGA